MYAEKAYVTPGVTGNVWFEIGRDVLNPVSPVPGIPSVETTVQVFLA
jgi:hypothetical protein